MKYPSQTVAQHHVSQIFGLNKGKEFYYGISLSPLLTDKSIASFPSKA